MKNLREEVIASYIEVKAHITRESILFSQIFNWLNEDKEEDVDTMVEVYPDTCALKEVEVEGFYKKVGEVLDNYYEGIKDTIYNDFE